MMEFSSLPPCLDLLEDFLRQLCLCTFRKDVFTQIKRLLHPDYAAKALAGEIPLCWPSIDQALQQWARPPQLARGNRLAVKSFDVLFTWLWEWKDGRYDRKGWMDKPYRMLYQQSFEIITQIRGKNQARQWKQTVKAVLVQGHWLLPYPHRGGFMQKSRETGQEIWWSNQACHR
jgi:hypothetical protein